MPEAFIGVSSPPPLECCCGANAAQTDRQYPRQPSKLRLVLCTHSYSSRSHSYLMRSSRINDTSIRPTPAAPPALLNTRRPIPIVSRCTAPCGTTSELARLQRGAGSSIVYSWRSYIAWLDTKCKTNTEKKAHTHV